MGIFQDEIINRIFKQIADNKDEIIIPAMNVVLADFTERIFEQGKDAKDQKIGKYSQFPYIQKLDEIGNVKKAKVKRLAEKQGRSKNVFLRKGYSELRDLAGFQNKFVDLNFTGSLFASIKIFPEKNGFAFVITGKSNIKKAVDNEARFDKTIFELSDSEQATLKTEILKNIERILKL